MLDEWIVPREDIVTCEKCIKCVNILVCERLVGNFTSDALKRLMHVVAKVLVLTLTGIPLSVEQTTLIVDTELLMEKFHLLEVLLLSQEVCAIVKVGELLVTLFLQSSVEVDVLRILFTWLHTLTCVEEELVSLAEAVSEANV